MTSCQNRGWLERLVSLASSAADIGMVAPMSNHAPAALLVDPIPYDLSIGRTDFQSVPVAWPPSP